MNEYDWDLFKEKMGIIGRGLTKGVERVGQTTGDYWSEFNRRYEATDPTLIDKVGVSLNPFLGFGTGLGKWADAAKEGFPAKETAVALASVVPAAGYTKLGIAANGAAKNITPVMVNDWLKTIGLLSAGTAATTAADEAVAADKRNKK